MLFEALALAAGQLCGVDARAVHMDAHEGFAREGAKGGLLDDLAHART